MLSRRNPKRRPAKTRRWGLPLIRALMLVVLTLFPRSGEPQNKSARMQHSHKRPEQSMESFLVDAPQYIEKVRELYRHWKKAQRDSVSAKMLKQMTEMLLQHLLWHDMRFMEVTAREPGAPARVYQALEFYDEHVRAVLRWYLRFLKSEDWPRLYENIAPQSFPEGVWREPISSPAALRPAEVAFYWRALELTERVPEKFRRPYASHAWGYDVPPTPAGGFAALQQQMPGLGSGSAKPRPGLLLLRLLVHRDGEVLRVRVVQSSGSAATDSAATALVRATRWHPAQHDGQAFTAEVVVPLRVW